MQEIKSENSLQKYRTIKQLYQGQIRQEVYKQIFERHLNLPYQIIEIAITEVQSIHTVFLPCVDKQIDKKENFYIGHGFGGSSVMNFYLLNDLLRKGNVILWEIRGMGFSTKLQEYTATQPQQILSFFIQGISVILQFYNHQNSTIIAHSLSSYLVLAFILKKQDLVKKHIKQTLLFSPVGITTKEEDYKFKTKTCKDFFQEMYHRFIWSGHFNHKTLFRTVLCCCKDCIIQNMIVEQMELDENESKLMLTIVKQFIELSNGSENLFFSLFEPRVLPKIALQPLFTSQPLINITIAFGGEKDWADKTGATKISQRFPAKIKQIEIQNANHNIQFQTQSCKELFGFLFK